MRAIEDRLREDYFKTQIEGSRRKFNYCKVSVSCVQNFRKVIYRSNGGPIEGPILCLGTRNGREINIFRKYFFGNQWSQSIMKFLENRKYAFSSRLPFIESLGKSDVEKIDKKSVVGVELNPDGRRKDVLVGSFDEMPIEWEGKFKIIYANTLDHAQNPHKTAEEWNRVLAPGGYIILGWPGETVDPGLINPTGNISFEDIVKLFPGEIIYFNKFGNAFGDIIIKK